MADTEHGKIAEQRIRTWLDRPDQGYSFDRIIIAPKQSIPKIYSLTDPED